MEPIIFQFSYTIETHNIIRFCIFYCFKSLISMIFKNRKILWGNSFYFEPSIRFLQGHVSYHKSLGRIGLTVSTFFGYTQRDNRHCVMIYIVTRRYSNSNFNVFKCCFSSSLFSYFYHYCKTPNFEDFSVNINGILKFKIFYPGTIFVLWPSLEWKNVRHQSEKVQNAQTDW